MVERVFDFKEILEEKKVKLITLKLRKYASLWWTNLCAKRVRRNKKIRTWEKIKSRLKSYFLPRSYLHDSYSQLYNLTQGSLSVEEYPREFEQLFIKCDLQEAEDQTIVRYLGELDSRYTNVVELQQYSTFDKVCVLAHKVWQQKKAEPHKRDLPKPLSQSEPLNKGISFPQSKPMTLTPFHPTTNQAPLKSLAPQNTANPSL